MALQEEFEAQGNFLFKYRSNFPLIFVAIGLFVFILQKTDPDFNNPISYSWIELLSLFVSLFGLFIRIFTVGYTPANTSGRNTKEGQVADKLNTSGIYSLVRHPLYLGNFFMWLGAVLLTVNVWFIILFAFVYWVYYERIMFAEEQFLRRKFHAVYSNWASRTSAFLPSFRRFIKPTYPFSFKKVLKKEKNGLVAIFVLLFLFHNLNYSIENRQVGIELNWIFWATIISAALYFILKLLKRNTDLLNEEGR
jgi:protein-S-isoprenylcysteine O-methyltransferase Ste14